MTQSPCPRTGRRSTKWRRCLTLACLKIDWNTWCAGRGTARRKTPGRTAWNWLRAPPKQLQTSTQHTPMLFLTSTSAQVVSANIGRSGGAMSQPYGRAPILPVFSAFFLKLVRSLSMSHDLGAWDLAFQAHLIMFHGLPSMCQASSHIMDTSWTFRPLFSVTVVTALCLRFSCTYLCSLCL